MTDAPLSEQIPQLLAPKRRPWYDTFVGLIVGVVILALSTATFVTSKVSYDLADQLSKYTTVTDCAAAWSRYVTETQNRYLTDGFGGVLLAAINKERTEVEAVMARSTFDRTLKASQLAVAERQSWVDNGTPLPCPID